MSIDFDTLIAEGQKFRQRKNQIAEARAQKSDRKITRQIAIAEQRLERIKQFLEKLTGKPVSLSINKKSKFPVKVDTGLISELPNYYRVYAGVFLSDPTSPVTIKGRGKKILLQAGCKPVGFSRPYLGHRILARGENNIIRYLAKNFPPARENGATLG
jgi:hypothetical protein